jgi:UDP-3-O-[3-hydroxymyristoyl] glucosamine N-acyltransferase
VTEAGTAAFAAAGPAVLDAQAIATRVGGTLRGDGTRQVARVAPLVRAEPDCLTFCAGPAQATALAATAAAVVLVPPALADAPAPGAGACVVVPDPQVALLSLLPVLHPPVPRAPGIHQTAIIGRGVVLGEGVSVGPYAVVGDGATLGARATVHAHAVIGPGVAVGDDSEVGPHATIHAGSALGRRVRVRAGARIGNEGFKYVFTGGAHVKMPHVGRCLLEDDVEVGANACVDRGTIDDTVIGAGTKLDNLVHIAHNVKLGRLCLVMAQVGIAGSVRVGDGVVLAGQVGVSDNHVIGDRAILAAQAGVFGDIPAGETWSGYPARPHREQLRAHAALYRLAGLVRPLERLLASRGDSPPDATGEGR